MGDRIHKKARVPLFKPTRRDKDLMKKDPNFRFPTVEFDYEKALATPENFDLMRQEVYAADQMDVLRIQRKIRNKRFKDQKIDEMSDKDIIVLYKELRGDQRDKFEQERLEKGESTKNVAVIVAAIKDLKNKEMTDE